MSGASPFVDPTVSILVPMRDAAGYVREALESILSEASVPFEVIVIDDGSQDASAEIVSALRDSRIRMIPGPAAGIAAALNAGLACVRGEIVMRCDADDRFTPKRIAWQAEWLRSHPEFDAVCGSFATMDERGRRISTLDTGEADQEITQELLEGKTRTHLCTYAIRSSLIKELRFRPYFQTAEDIDFQLRLGNAGRVWYQAEPAYEYRLHDSSTVHTQANVRRVFFERTAREFAAQRRETSMDDLQRGCPPLPPTAAGKPHDSIVQRQGMLLGEAWRFHGKGNRWEAIKTGWRACWIRPTDWRTWRSFVALAVKR